MEAERLSGKLIPNRGLTTVKAVPFSFLFLFIVFFMHIELSFASLGDALDAPSLSWSTSGSAGTYTWLAENSVYYYGGSAAQSAAIGDNQYSWIQTPVTGPGTLSFYWKVSSELSWDYLTFSIDGQLQEGISGERNWEQKTVSIGSGVHFLKWEYRKDNSGSSGADAGWLDKVIFQPAISLGDALDAPSLSWSTSGSAGTYTWLAENSVYYYGGSAAQSAAIGDNQYSWIQTPVTGPGTLSFYWKVSSELSWDYLTFSIDGQLQEGISGERNWEQKTVSIGSGVHFLKWEYRKDNSGSSGADAGWLDKVIFQYQSSSTTTIQPVSSTTTYRSSSTTTIQPVSSTTTFQSSSTTTIQPVSSTTTYRSSSTTTYQSSSTTTVLPVSSTTTYQSSSTTTAVPISSTTTYRSSSTTTVPGPHASNPMIAGGGQQTVGLKSDGTVVSVGQNNYGQCNVGGWSGIVQVASGFWHTVGLKSDGTVVALGDNRAGECNVDGWSGIVQVDAGNQHTVGRKSDGTVVAVGQNIYGECNVGGWTGIVQVSAGRSHSVGLKSDGTVVAVGSNDNGQCNVSGWSGIVQVAGGYDHTIGLKSDGTVVAVGSNDYGECNVGEWTGIDQVSSASLHTVGLKSDGTVVSVGRNDSGQCNVGGWSGIVQVSAGWWHTVGLKFDGTVVAVGSNLFGQCNVSYWILRGLNGISISGPTQVDENSGAQYTCTANFADGSSADVTGSASWSEDSSYTSISGSGYLTTNSVNVDQAVTLAASFRGKSDTHEVTVKNVMPISSTTTYLSSTTTYLSSTTTYRFSSTTTVLPVSSTTTYRSSSTTTVPGPQVISLKTSLDNQLLTFATGGNANWFGQTATFYYGGSAARSGAIADDQFSWLQTTVTGAGTLSFYWKVSSEGDYDYLEFYLDGIKQAAISGDEDWQQVTYNVPTGTHTLKWQYRKDYSVSSGSDCAWVDKLVIPSRDKMAPALLLLLGE